jgi:hypothetical protein
MGIGYGINPDWATNTDEGRSHIANSGINQQGLVFNLDMGSSLCYSGTGTTVNDLKNNHNPSMINGIAYSSSDNYGALILDGLNDYLQVTGGIPLASPISLTTNFTIEQVFKPTAYASSTYFGLANMLLQKGPASTYNYATQVSNATTVSFIKRTSPESLNFHNFTVPAMTNQINIVTFVITSGTTVNCYFNGNFINSLAITGLAITAVNNDPLYIGSFAATTNTNFTGSYYSCRIYNRALNAQEIRQNFNALRNRFNLSASSAPINTATPTISGTVAVGNTLTVANGTWTSPITPTFRYQWQRGTSDIGGAIDNTYRVQVVDNGSTLRCIVRATNDFGFTFGTSGNTSTVPVVSAPTNTALPTISGTVRVGQTITSSTGTWTGTPTPTYTYQWQRDSLYIPGATSSSYLIQPDDFNKILKCLVTATVTSNGLVVGTESVTSNSTAAVTSAPINIVLPNIEDDPIVGQTISVNNGEWIGTLPITFTYQWQRGTTNISGATSNSYTVQGADAGNTLRCIVTATNSISSASATSNNTITAIVVSLYQFTSATFTPGGQTGQNGPSLAQARTGLTGTGTDTWKNNTEFFNTTDGIQLWTVPEDGTYRIEAWGAQGGTAGSQQGGRPARMRGDFALTKGEIIRIIVGQQGQSGPHTQDGQPMGAGGGGSFVVRTPYSTTGSILVIAGGGGGAAQNSWSNAAGNNASTTNNGTTTGAGTAGTGGNGGGGGGGDGSGPGGAGFTGNGLVDPLSGNSVGDNSKSFTNGGRGGRKSLSWGGSEIWGGFGGGGGGGGLACGGGGGYSGGGGGTWSSPQQGGGGGSFNSGTNQSNSIDTTRTGPGQVIITKI